MDDLEGKHGTQEEKKMHIREPGIWRDRIAAVLLVIAAIAAIGGCIMIILFGDFSNPSLQVPLVWQALAYIFFSGLFFLLAVSPRAYPGVWELSFFQTGGMSIAALALIGLGNAGALEALWVNGILITLLIIAYILSGGFSAWGRFRHL